MGATRALVTIRRLDGTMLYVNDIAMAHFAVHSFLHEGDLIDGLVANRLDMIKPALRAQTVQGLATQQNQRSAVGLIPDIDNMVANAAKHSAFHRAEPLSGIPRKELRRMREAEKLHERVQVKGLTQLRLDAA